MSVNIKGCLNKILDWHTFSYDRYINFLVQLSAFTVLPLNEFRAYHNDKEVVIGLRHDIDSQFEKTVRMTLLEEMMGMRSTLFYLHSAKYYGSERLYFNLKALQDKGFEIGLHNDLVSLGDPANFLIKELTRLKAHGINYYGTAAHGRPGVNNKDFWNTYDLEGFGFQYEAYSLDHNKYFSDCAFISGRRWHPEMFDWNSLKPGDRVQVLIHCEHWHR